MRSGAVTRREAASSLVAGVASAAALALASRARVLAGEKPASEAAALAAREQLVGEWKLNPELSEDPREKLRQARGAGGHPQGGGPPGGWGGSGGGPPGGGGGGGHRGPGGPGGSGGRGGPGGPHGGGEPRAQSMAFTASQITVANLEPEITMLEPDGEVRRLHADDKAYKNASGDEVKTRWDEGRLIVETRAERGSVKESWAVGSDPRRLTLLLEIKGAAGAAVSVKRVFDPVATDTPPR